MADKKDRKAADKAPPKDKEKPATDKTKEKEKAAKPELQKPDKKWLKWPRRAAKLVAVIALIWFSGPIYKACADFLGKSFAWAATQNSGYPVGNKRGRVAAMPAKPYKTVFILEGEEVQTKKSLNTTYAGPAGWRIRYEGPREAKIHFDGGFGLPIHQEFGVKGGVVTFSGPKGKEVVVSVGPN